jgi:hypothetical protein
MSKTIALSKPIRAHNQDVSELTLREPTGADLVAAGVPFSTSIDEATGEPRQHFEPSATTEPKAKAKSPDADGTSQPTDGAS